MFSENQLQKVNDRGVFGYNELSIFSHYKLHTIRCILVHW